jgi:hypothetical protein
VCESKHLLFKKQFVKRSVIGLQMINHLVEKIYFNAFLSHYLLQYAMGIYTYIDGSLKLAATYMRQNIFPKRSQFIARISYINKHVSKNPEISVSLLS